MLGYPGPEPPAPAPAPGAASAGGAAAAVTVGLRLAPAQGSDAPELSFFSTITTFGTAVDVTVSELALEAFFPADGQTAEYLRT
jgi:hypothetical protein